jgi:hypothetical protein
MPESELEEEVIKNFIIKQRKERYLGLIKTRKAGEGFGELAHFTQNLDLRFCSKIPNLNKKAEIEFVTKSIKENTKAKNCYIMSESPAFDGKWMKIEEAVEQVVGSNLGTILIMENGKLIYHESEEIKERYIGIRI